MCTTSALQILPAKLPEHTRGLIHCNKCTLTPRVERFQTLQVNAVCAEVFEAYTRVVAWRKLSTRLCSIDAHSVSHCKLTQRVFGNGADTNPTLFNNLLCIQEIDRDRSGHRLCTNFGNRVSGDPRGRIRMLPWATAARQLRPALTVLEQAAAVVSMTNENQLQLWMWASYVPAPIPASHVIKMYLQDVGCAVL